MSYEEEDELLEALRRTAEAAVEAYKAAVKEVNNPRRTANTRRYRANNPERYRALDRESKRSRYHSDPDYRAKVIARNGAYQKRRSENSEEYRQQKLAYKRSLRARNPEFAERERQYNREYRERKKAEKEAQK